MVGHGVRIRRAVELESARVRLRSIDPDDIERLSELLGTDGVRWWWSLYDEERARAEYLGQDVGMYLVEAGNGPVGAMEYVESTDPDYRRAEIDVFACSVGWTRELGAEAIGLLAKHLVYAAGHHRLTAAPHADNEESLEMYRAAGFREVGVLREYERRPEGGWRDCVLFELLRRDVE